MPSLGSQPESTIAFQDLTLYQCRQLVSCCGDTGKAHVLEGDDGCGLGSKRSHFSNFMVDC